MTLYVLYDRVRECIRKLSPVASADVIGLDEVVPQNVLATSKPQGREVSWKTAGNTMLPGNYRAFLGGDRRTKCLVDDL